jgi:hypothetical protein
VLLPSPQRQQQLARTIFQHQHDGRRWGAGRRGGNIDFYLLHACTNTKHTRYTQLTQPSIFNFHSTTEAETAEARPTESSYQRQQFAIPSHPIPSPSTHNSHSFILIVELPAAAATATALATNYDTSSHQQAAAHEDSSASGCWLGRSSPTRLRLTTR